MAKQCKVEGCEEGGNKDRKTGLCSTHSTTWLRSPEFSEAMKDEDVVGYMALGLKDRAMMTVNRKYKVRWLKRLAKEES